jgi:hypothetical protein
LCKTGTQTATTTSAPNPEAMAAYSGIMGKAGQVADTPFTPYNAPLVAPVNEQQYQGIAGINNNANYAQPYIDAGAGLALAGASPITQDQINQYASPYMKAVVDATQAQFNNQNAQQQQQVKGNAIAQGAMGGNREAIAEAETANQENLAQAPVIAGLENQGYTQGVNTALTEQQAKAAGAYSMGNLGVAGQNAALTGANAQIGAGTLEQQTQQQLYSSAYQQFLNQLAYPFQTTQWLAGIDSGLGSQMGGQSSTTQPGPNQLAQDLGLGVAGVGAAGSAMSGAAALMAVAGGGRVERADGGGVANRHITVPETHETMMAQQHQLVRGHRRAQMFPHGTKELSLPKGMQRVESGGGVFHFNPRYLSAKDIHHHSAAQTENHLLDLGPFSKGEVLHRVAGGEIPLAVVERDPHGTEVRAALGTHVTAPHQFEALHRTKSPGHTIHIEDVRSTLGRRMQGGRVQGLDTGGVAFQPFGGAPSTPAMPYSGGSSFIPTNAITRGPGAPGAPKMGQQPDYAGDAMKAVAGMQKQIGQSPGVGGGKTGTGGPMGVDPGTMDASGKGGGSGLDLATNNFDEGGLYRRGGAVHPLVGVANTHSIRMPQNYYRGGVVQHFDDGGAAAPDFDNEFYSPIQHTDPLREIMSDPQAMSAYASRASADALAAHPGVAPSIPETPRSMSIDADSDMPPIIRNGPRGAGIAPSQNDGTLMAYTAPDQAPGVSPSTGIRHGANYDKPFVPTSPAEGVSPKSTFSLPSHLGNVDLSNTSKLWPSLMAMGFGMASSRNPSFAGAVGEGGLRGIAQYSAEQQQDMSQQKIKLEAQKLSQELELNRQKLAEETRYHNIEAEKPIKWGVDPITMHEIGLMRMGDNKWHKVDINTGHVDAIGSDTPPPPQPDTGPRAPSAPAFPTAPTSSVPATPGTSMAGTLPPNLGMAAGGVPDADAAPDPVADVVALPGGDAPVAAPPVKVADAGSDWGRYAQQVAQPPQQRAAAPGGSSLYAPPKEVGEDQLPLHSILVSDTDPNFGQNIPGTNPEVLETYRKAGVPEGTINRARAVGNGLQPIITAGRLTGGDSALVQRIANEFNPSLDGNVYQNRLRTSNYFNIGTGSGGGNNVTAINTWAQHLNDYLASMKKLDPWENQYAESARDWATNKGMPLTSSERRDALAAAALQQKAVADEGAKIFAGQSGGALADRDEWMNRLPTNVPFHVAFSEAKALQHLVEGRLSSLADQYNQGMHSQHADKEFLAPRTRQVMDNILNSDATTFKPIDHYQLKTLNRGFSGTPTPMGTGAPEPTAAPANPGTPALPPQAAASLKEGVHTTFGNGQTWTLQNGKPVQVP